MALATQCPHCQTTFRVVHDQLKLRAGLVRCGHCKEIFNGIEHLLPPPDAESTEKISSAVEPAVVATHPNEFVAEQTVEEPSLATAADEPTSSAATVVVEDDIEAEANRTPSDQIDFDIPDSFEPEIDSEPQQSVEPETSKREDPLQRMTLVDFTREYPEENDSTEQKNTGERELSNAEDRPTFDPHSKDELDEAIEDLQRKPWRSNKKSAKAKTRRIQAEPESIEDDEPTFVKRGRRIQRLDKKLRIAIGIACFILLIAALVQATYLFRNQIAGMFPQAKPFLTQLCDALACSIELPTQITAVSIESSELQTLAENKDTFVLTTLLRNYSDTLQAWPHIELTLNDANEKPLLRRVFKPGDYLTESEVRKGFAASSEHSVKLSFELAQIKASGYRVYLFYP
ncbi:DUF3426 domain-containing protein [Herminiimonas fonticola]|uniref:Putative Zn finger-like uncharacterized protein n=1 Tax=Herminiimonas fonticola TaxID=303380 RepID=A0A4R6GH43_9BURK|nr:DUF3426 domain-containing protein [Herminiimonas fonticola]RBA25164.1 MJ0042 family finger-like domain [Herminiimonas fonticola]TDN94279.1 putative Zn finger-like uncharacterized protein [Herminiimonas fonticola]